MLRFLLRLRLRLPWGGRRARSSCVAARGRCGRSGKMHAMPRSVRQHVSVWPAKGSKVVQTVQVRHESSVFPPKRRANQSSSSLAMLADVRGARTALEPEEAADGARCCDAGGGDHQNTHSTRTRRAGGEGLNLRGDGGLPMALTGGDGMQRNPPQTRFIRERALGLRLTRSSARGRPALAVLAVCAPAPCARSACAALEGRASSGSPNASSRAPNTRAPLRSQRSSNSGVPCAASHTGQQNHGSLCTRLVPMTKTVGVQQLIGERLPLPLHSSVAKCGSRNNPMLPFRFSSTRLDRSRRHPTTCPQRP